MQCHCLDLFSEFDHLKKWLQSFKVKFFRSFFYNEIVFFFISEGRKKFGHRGANRRFTNWEELSQQSREIELERQRKALEEDNENSGEDGEKDPAAPGGDSSNKVRVVNFDKKQDKVIDIKKGSSSSDEESEESSEDEEVRYKFLENFF